MKTPVSARMESTLRWLKGPTVLDVGCTGHKGEAVGPDADNWLHGRVRRKFKQVAGIDISQDILGKLRVLGYDNVHLQSAEEFQLDERFDTIVAGELIEHLSSPGEFLKRAKQHLKPGGQIVLTTPYPFSLMYMLYGTFKYPKTCPNAQHTCWFCPATMHELVSRFGLKITHWELIQDYLPDPRLPVKYHLTRRLIKVFSALGFPRRLTCNCMLFVLESQE